MCLNIMHRICHSDLTHLLDELHAADGYDCGTSLSKLQETNNLNTNTGANFTVFVFTSPPESRRVWQTADQCTAEQCDSSLSLVR